MTEDEYYEYIDLNELEEELEMDEYASERRDILEEVEEYWRTYGKE